MSLHTVKLRLRIPPATNIFGEPHTQRVLGLAAAGP
jgi:hypothetical protein